MQTTSYELAYEILKEINAHAGRHHHPAETLTHTEELLLTRVQQFLPSRVGAFEEAFAIGLCVASGWAEQNVDLLAKRTAFEEALFTLWDKGVSYVYQKHPRLNPKDKNEMEQVICQGFLEGVSLGKKVRELSVCTKMSTQKVVETLDIIGSDPTAAVRHICARSKHVCRQSLRER
ncbi:MAG: hypothetical protein ACI4QM_01145 [Alphaproteobacteria bacterium]